MNDVQNQIDKRNIDIQKVGVKDVEIPLVIQRKLHGGNADSQRVYAKAKMSVSLNREFKGTHMSRFIEILNDYRKQNLVGVDIKKMLYDIRERLDSKNAYIKFDFKLESSKLKIKETFSYLSMYILMEWELNLPSYDLTPVPDGIFTVEWLAIIKALVELALSMLAAGVEIFI